MMEAYEEYFVREKDIDAKEKAYWQQVVELEKARTAMERQRMELEKQRADIEAQKAVFYENLYKTAIKKKGGFKCFLKRFFSVGLARC